MKSEHYIPFQLQVLTPVHIGSGDIFTPLSYVVRNPQEGKYELWLVDGSAWLACHAEDQKVALALENGSMEDLRRFINSAEDINYFIQAKISIPSSILGKNLFISRANIDSTAEIQAFIRNPFTCQPYVPASSVKGAISTALAWYIDERRKKSGLPRLCNTEGKEDKKIRDDIYGKISAHSMRALRLSDMPVPPGSTSIRKPIRKDIDPPKFDDKTSYCETLNPESAKLAPISGLMRLFSSGDSKCVGLYGTKACISLKNPSENIDAGKLWEICNSFYKKRFIDEYNKFYKNIYFQSTGKALEKTLEHVENLAQDEMLLRIGRYSHIECVTISGIPKGKETWGISRTLADALLPFGWVILKRCAMEEYNEGQTELAQLFASESAKVEAIAQERGKLQAEAMQKARVAAEAKAKLQEEAERKAKEEAEARQKCREESERKVREEEEARQKREEILASLGSDEERAIYKLGEEGADDSLAQEIYSKLDGFGNFKTKAAEALKDFWQKNNKWEGKELSKKQVEKVKKIKEILGITAPVNAEPQTAPKGKKKKKK